MGSPTVQIAALSGGPTGGLVALVLGSIALAALSWRRPSLTGTTLVAPWTWSLVSIVSIAGSEILIAAFGSPAPDWAAHLRFAAAMSTFCPAMALLGAKRPQHRGWQAIVLSLWSILSLESIQWLLFGGVSEIHPARSWFLAILIAVGTANGLGTRYWPSSLLFAAGQLALLAPFLASRAELAGVPAPLVGMAALVLSWVLVAAQLPRGRGAATSLDRVWLDFRDAYGVVWALRVAERINASARMYDWPVLLGWRGFYPRDPHATLQIPDAVEESLRTLLRRFVSPQWIEARLGQAVPDCNTSGSVG